MRIFLNEQAENIEELIANGEWDLKQLYNNVYIICIENKETNWLVKKYSNKKYATIESIALKKLQGLPGIPSVLSTGLSDKLCYVILSKENGCDLHDYVINNGVFTEKDVKNIMVQLLKIVMEIHKKNIIHYDIKPENIIYDEKTKKVILIDFEGKITRKYSSPEQIKGGRGITSKTDIWSLGVTMYFLLTASTNIKKLKDKKFSVEMMDFFDNLLEENPNIRCSAEEALHHEWITE